ncbi:MAG: hypothetical protein JKX78_02945 [Alteromonadaceae bacterium]|nr:hypothetical protein [Alteromonadaceae bacterium]
MKKVLIGITASLLLVACQFEIGLTVPDDYEPIKVVDVGDDVVIIPPADEDEGDDVVIVPADIHTLPPLDTSGALWVVDFENHSNGTTYTDNVADGDFHFQWETISAKASTIVNGRWEMLIPKDQIKKGVHAAKDIVPTESVYFGYEIEFHPGYDFSTGGKLPGLVGLNKDLKKSNGNQVYPDGCNAYGQGPDEGFSLRSMFREDGRAIGYFYHQDNPLHNGYCGEEIDYIHNGEPFKFQRGVSYYVETYAQMNDANESNGIVRIWVNGQLVLERTDMMLGENRIYDINHMMFYFWHGGSSSSWAPSVDSRVSFDNVILSSTPISH